MLGSQQPLYLSRAILSAWGTRLFAFHEDRIPQTGPLLVVSNHRSFMDAPLLMQALNRPIRFACHRYMARVPGLRQAIAELGGFALDAGDSRHQTLFDCADRLLADCQTVGIFPEGGQKMVRWEPPEALGRFHRGFAHLALRASVPELAVLPVAIAPAEERNYPWLPLDLLSWFDPGEPLFRQGGLHPMVVYQRANVWVGRPLWVGDRLRSRYRGKHARAATCEIADYCRAEIAALLAADRG